MRIWVITLFILLSLKTEIAIDLSKHHDFLGHHAEDAMSGAVPRSDKSSDLITDRYSSRSSVTDCESGNNHRYCSSCVQFSSVVNGSEADPCKTKTCLETNSRVQKFLATREDS